MRSTAPLELFTLSSLHSAFVSEHAVLEQIIYKNRNQHRKTNYYQRLVEVLRHNRHIDLLTVHDDLLQPSSPSSPSSPSPSLPPFALSTLHHLRCSFAAILRAADPLYALLQQTYFMPLALSSLALLARLLVLVKSALLVVMTEGKDREEKGKGGVNFKPNTVGARILAALKEARGELVVAQLDGYELHERWTEQEGTGAIPSTRPPAPVEPARPTSEAEQEMDKFAVQEVDDIPFFDDEQNELMSSHFSARPVLPVVETKRATSPLPVDPPQSVSSVVPHSTSSVALSPSYEKERAVQDELMIEVDAEVSEEEAENEVGDERKRTDEVTQQRMGAVMSAKKERGKTVRQQPSPSLSVSPSVAMSSTLPLVTPGAQKKRKQPSLSPLTLTPATKPAPLSARSAMRLSASTTAPVRGASAQEGRKGGLAGSKVNKTKSKKVKRGDEIDDIFGS